MKFAVVILLVFIFIVAGCTSEMSGDACREKGGELYSKECPDDMKMIGRITDPIKMADAVCCV